MKDTGEKWIAQAINGLAQAVTYDTKSVAEDASGGCVASLTESVMGVTAGLCRIADAIEYLAEAIKERES